MCIQMPGRMLGVLRYYSSLLSLKSLLLNLELPVVDEADRPVGLTVAG